MHTDVELRLGIIVTRRKSFARQGDILAIFIDRHVHVLIG